MHSEFSPEVCCDKSDGDVVNTVKPTILVIDDAPANLLPPDADRGIPGQVIERNYKGMTLDSVVRLDTGQEVRVSEFFDENDPDFDYRRGEPVRVSWVPGWETLLPHED